MVNSRAAVATDRPERYARQLASHFDHKIEVRHEDAGPRLYFDGGNCLLSAADDTLVLVAHADDEASLRRVEHVVGSHLERFGQRDGLTVAWASCG